MWNTAIVSYKGYTNFMNVQDISKSLFRQLSTYNVNKLTLSKSTVKKIEKAKKQDNHENAIYELIKSNAISKRIFKRFLTQKRDVKNNENGYYVNYKYYDIIIERLLNFVYIIDRNILIEAHNLTINATFNNAKTVTNLFIPIQKLAIDDVEKYKAKKYSDYIINKLCLLNHRLNELDSRRPIL